MKKVAYFRKDENTNFLQIKQALVHSKIMQFLMNTLQK